MSRSERGLLEKLKASDGVTRGELATLALEVGVDNLQQFINRHRALGTIRIDSPNRSQPELIKPTRRAWEV